MDVLAHLLWTYIIFHGQAHLPSALAFSVLPDVVSFGIYLIYILVYKRNVGRWLVTLENDLGNTPAWVFRLYNLSHSLIVSTAVFLIASFILGRVFWEATAWMLHIIIDIPLHKRKTYPTPFLWPLFRYTFHGISWASKKFIIINYIVIILVLSLIYLGII